MSGLNINKTSTTTNEVHTIFTRYLYDKYSVSGSLVLSMLDNKIEQSLVWGYELYYSGFNTETMDLVVYIYEVFYKKNNPSFKKFISEKYNEWCLDNSNECILATLIRNILSLHSCYYIESIDTDKPILVKKKPIKIIYFNKDIEKYKTKECDSDSMRPNWRFLSKVCIYPIYDLDSHYHNHLFNTNSNTYLSEKMIGIKPTNKKVLLNTWLYHWEYYSEKSPIWKNRIEKNGGTLNHETNQLVFISDESKDQYYEKYGYEPDEQSNEIEQKCIGVCTKDLMMYS